MKGLKIIRGFPTRRGEVRLTVQFREVLAFLRPCLERGLWSFPSDADYGMLAGCDADTHIYANACSWMKIGYGQDTHKSNQTWRRKKAFLLCKALGTQYWRLLGMGLKYA